MDDTFREQQSYQEAVAVYPSRGAIKDRNGKLLVVNEAMYNINATYNTIKKSDLDTMYFCQLLQISDSAFQANINKDWSQKEFSQRKPFPFLTQIPSDQLHRYKNSFIYSKASITIESMYVAIQVQLGHICSDISVRSIINK